jgi:hypothetical protein
MLVSAVVESAVTDRISPGCPLALAAVTRTTGSIVIVSVAVVHVCPPVGVGRAVGAAAAPGAISLMPREAAPMRTNAAVRTTSARDRGMKAPNGS